MHPPGAKTPIMVHPAICSCVTHYINLSNGFENHEHAGCTGFKSVCQAAKMCTHGAGCTFDFENWTGMNYLNLYC